MPAPSATSHAPGASATWPRHGAASPRPCARGAGSPAGRSPGIAWASGMGWNFLGKHAEIMKKKGKYGEHLLNSVDIRTYHADVWDMGCSSPVNIGRENQGRNGAFQLGKSSNVEHGGSSRKPDGQFGQTKMARSHHWARNTHKWP